MPRTAQNCPVFLTSSVLADPDLLERNAHNVRIQKIPLPFRYAQMLSLMVHFPPLPVHASALAK